uniref:Uncharacterized protein n=1 Tax=Sphaerodactylus townsendi TaxID=933632 RepID=A0ACB8GCP2_9SAUR
MENMRTCEKPMVDTIEVEGVIAEEGSYEATQPVDTAAVPNMRTYEKPMVDTIEVEGVIAEEGSYEATQPVDTAAVPDPEEEPIYVEMAQSQAEHKPPHRGNSGSLVLFLNGGGGGLHASLLPGKKHMQIMDNDFSAPLGPLLVTESIEMAMEVEMECSRFCGFSCTSDIRTGKRSFSTDSYLASGSLKRILLRLDPFPTDYEEDTVELFGFQWVTETALVESCTLLFGLFRQQIHKLENLIQPSSAGFGQASNLHWEAHNIRQQCIKFLQYVKVFIFRYLEPLKTEDDELLHSFEKQEIQLASLLVEELHSLTLYIGRLYELPSSILGEFSIQSQAKLFTPSWHLLHLHLDIRWSVLEILHILGEKLPNGVQEVEVWEGIEEEAMPKLPAPHRMLPIPYLTDSPLRVIVL